MTQVSPECAVGYAMIGGWRTQNDIITAVAVAMQESNLNTDAANSCCVGLWQINLKAWNTTADKMKNPVANAQMAYKIWQQQGHGSFCSTGSPSSHTCNPWQAYGASQPGRSWQQALQMAKNAYASVLAKGIASDILSGDVNSTAGDPLKVLAEKGLDCVGEDVLNTGLSVPNPLGAAEAVIAAFNRMGAWITNPDNLMRIVKVGLGAVIVIVGGAALMDKELSGPAASIARKVIP